MDLPTIISTLTREVRSHEDGTDPYWTDTNDSPTNGSMIADEVAYQIQEGLFNGDLQERLKLIQKITSYDIGEFVRRYPTEFGFNYGS